MTIKEMREKLGLSQAQFSRRYGIPKRSIGNWETGSRTPPEYFRALLERIVLEDAESSPEGQGKGDKTTE